MLLAALAGIVFVSCASGSAGTFARDGLFTREALELRDDGTFVYCAWSDDGPTVFSARGTWRWLDRARRQLETVTTARRVERGHVTSADNLPDVVVWTASRNTLQRPDRLVLRRASVEALAYGGCTAPQP